jgi:bifunctional non-homologous end joining protein LigD
MRPLQEYEKKRNFKKTAEPKALIPKGKASKAQSQELIFVVQEHHASHLHYDFRLEWNGVLKSWAVPKGPSLDPSIKRLAVEVEDHPISYAKFKGSIPVHEYGGGEVYIWDSGVWNPKEDPSESLKKGRLEFTLKGKRLKGDWILIRTRRSGSSGKNQWLLMKRKDAFAEAGNEAEIIGEDLKKLDLKDRRRASPETEKKKVTKLTHPDKIIFQKEKITKQDILNYYTAVESWMMPHLKDRPLSLLRCPNGSTKECFFQKHISNPPPDGVHPVEIKEKTAVREYMTVDSLGGLSALVQQGTLEFHAWNCRRRAIENPDQIVMDFDPDPSIVWSQVKDGVRELKEILDQLEIQSFLKVTGGKGLHVHIPLKPVYSWQQIKDFSWTLAQEMISRKPKSFTTTLSKQARTKKVFIDYLRNTRGATAIIPYSLRAKAFSSVALPLEWNELGSLEGPNLFTMEKALEQITKRKEDPWKDFLKSAQKIQLLKE